MTNERPDPSHFTGETDKSTGDEVEEAGRALESSDESSGILQSARQTLKGAAGTVSGYSAEGNGNGDNGNNRGYAGEPEDSNRRKFLYVAGGFLAGGAAVLAADGADGEIDGDYEILGGEEPSTQPTGNQTGNQTPGQTPVDGQGPTNVDNIYFDSLSDLPDEACYRSEGGVSGYFAASDIENVLGESATEGLTPSAGDIAYDVDFRDSDGDGQADAYVMQLAGTNDQNDLTVQQAETLFEELELDGSYC